MRNRHIYEHLVTKINRSKSLVLNEKEYIDFTEDDIEEQAIENAKRAILDHRASEIRWPNRYSTYWNSPKPSKESYDANRDKMIQYQKKGSSVARMANSCDSYDKIALRYAIAREIGWPEAAQAFVDRYTQLFWDNDPQKRSFLGDERRKIQKKVDDAKQYQADFDNTNTDEYAPTTRDWEKMINYMNKKSNPDTLARTCKDHNKLVARYIIAKALGWSEAAYAFEQKILDSGILNKAQLAAYAARYATYNIPEEYKDLIDDMIANDQKGGIAQHANNQTSAVSELPDKLVKVLDNDSNIKSYTVTYLPYEQRKGMRVSEDSRYRYRTIESNAKGTQYKVTVTDFNDNQNEFILMNYRGQSWHLVTDGQTGIDIPKQLSETAVELQSYLQSIKH